MCKTIDRGKWNRSTMCKSGMRDNVDKGLLKDTLGVSYVNGTYKKLLNKLQVDKVMATNSRFVEEAKHYKDMKIYKKKNQKNKKKNEFKNKKKDLTTKFRTQLGTLATPDDKQALQIKFENNSINYIRNKNN